MVLPAAVYNLFTCVLLSRSTLDSKSEKSSRPPLKSKPLLAMIEREQQQSSREAEVDLEKRP
jgi:hypothetical protein